MTDKGKSPALPSDDLQALVEQFNASHWRTLELEFYGSKLFLSKDVGTSPGWGGIAPAGAFVATAATAAPQLPAHTAAVAALAAPASGPVVAEGHVIVNAPSLGTFYRSPKPGAEAFTQVGEAVEADTELCLIEVMKLFTTLRAGVKGKVVKILVEDGVMVEYDQPLFVIDPNG